LKYGQATFRVRTGLQREANHDAAISTDTVDGLRTRVEAGGTRDPGLGGLMSDINLEVKDEAQMDELGKSTDDSIKGAQHPLFRGLIRSFSRPLFSKQKRTPAPD
jgi:hypothetical protein